MNAATSGRRTNHGKTTGQRHLCGEKKKRSRTMQGERNGARIRRKTGKREDTKKEFVVKCHFLTKSEGRKKEIKGGKKKTE